MHQGIDLKIHAASGMVDIRTPFPEGGFAFNFASMAGMYKTPDTNGFACQVNDEALRQDLEAMSQKIVSAIEEFGVKHPESGIFDSATLALKQRLFGISPVHAVA